MDSSATGLTSPSAVVRARASEGPPRREEPSLLAGGASAQNADLTKTSVEFGFGNTVSLPGLARVNKGRKAVLSLALEQRDIRSCVLSTANSLLQEPRSSRRPSRPVKALELERSGQGRPADRRPAAARRPRAARTPSRLPGLEASLPIPANGTAGTAPNRRPLPSCPTSGRGR